MIELVPCADMSRWDALLEAQPRATVFHSRAWLDLVARISNAQLYPLMISRRGQTVGVFPLFMLRRGPFRIVASPPAQAATPVLGPLVEDDLIAETLSAFVIEARRLRAAYCELRFDGECPVAAVQGAGLQRTPRATFVLDLSSGPEALWQERFTGPCRRAIRKAEAAGLEVGEGDLRACADRVHALAAGVYARHHRPPPLSRDDYVLIGEVAERSRAVKVLLVRHAGAIVAAGIFPFGHGTVYYLDGVSDPGAQSMRPNNLLHWALIQWACARGLERYDMVGAGIPGVARFKRTFGPVEVPYTYCHRSLSSTAALARAAYAKFAPAGRALRHSLEKVRRKGEP